jgi:hypothetical protein
VLQKCARPIALFFQLYDGLTTSEECTSRWAMYTIKGPQLLTYGREDFPVYCAHEPLMELQDIKARGAPFVVIEPAHEIGKQHCNFIIDKDKSKIPRNITSGSASKKPMPNSYYE